MGLFSKKIAAKPGNSPVVEESLRVSVLADPQGLDFIRLQLELDIKGKSLGYRPIPYTLFELIELEKLVSRSPQPGRSSVLYTHSERRQLAAYVVKYYVLARDIEDFEKATAYNRLLTSLLELATLIDVPL